MLLHARRRKRVPLTIPSRLEPIITLTPLRHERDLSQRIVARDLEKGRQGAGLEVEEEIRGGAARVNCYGGGEVGFEEGDCALEN